MNNLAVMKAVPSNLAFARVVASESFDWEDGFGHQQTLPAGTYEFDLTPAVLDKLTPHIEDKSTVELIQTCVPVRAMIARSEAVAVDDLISVVKNIANKSNLNRYALCYVFNNETFTSYRIVNPFYNDSSMNNRKIRVRYMVDALDLSREGNHYCVFSNQSTQQTNKVVLSEFTNNSLTDLNFLVLDDTGDDPFYTLQFDLDTGVNYLQFDMYVDSGLPYLLQVNTSDGFDESAQLNFFADVETDTYFNYTI